MEQTNFNQLQKLPNDQTSMILGITSYLGCCCTNGVLGLILAGVGFYLNNKDQKLYNENPGTYTEGNLNTNKVLNLIGIILSIISLGSFIFMKSTGMYDEMMGEYMKVLKEAQGK